MSKKVGKKITNVAVARIMESQRLLLNYSYFWGLIPMKMVTKTSFVHHSNSRWILARYTITLTVVLFPKFIFLGIFAHDALSGQIDIRRNEDLVRLLFCAQFIFSGFLHVHTAWKSREIEALINNYNIYFTRFQDECALSYGPKRKDLYGVLTKGFFFGTLILQFSSIIAFSKNCYTHYYAPLLPICVQVVSSTTGRITWEHQDSTIYFTLAAILQFVVAVDLVAATYASLAFALPAILTGGEMQRALTDTTPESYLYSHSNWMHHYRSFQILISQVNDWAQEYLMPFHISGLITLIVLMNYFLISFEMSPSVVSYILTMNVCLSGYLGILLSQATEIMKTSRIGLDLRKSVIKPAALTSALASGSPENQTELEHKVRDQELRAVEPMKIRIGSMRYLDEEARLIAYCAIVDYTVSMLLTFK